MEKEVLNENGIPQTDIDEIDETVDVQSDDTEISGDKIAPIDDSEIQQSDAEPDNEKVTVLEDLSPADGFFPRAQRIKSPFSVRMKVTGQFIVITLKRVENDDTQVFYIPVRW